MTPPDSRPGNTIIDMAASNLRRPDLSPELAGQLSAFIDRLEEFNDSRPELNKMGPENYRFLREFIPKIISERNKRVKEVGTPEYKGVVDRATALLPMPNYNVFCMDGRVLPPLVFLETYGMASSIRVPGGNMSDFAIGTDGTLFLRKDTKFAGRLKRIVEKHGVVAEVLDSHIGCAARGKEEAACGKHPHDGGLFADVLHKRNMAFAIKRFVEEEFGSGKRIVSIKTSFDPHSGFLYMGLGSDAAIRFAEANASERGIEPAFTPEVVQELVDKGLIISTSQLVQDGIIGKLFEEHGGFEMDWKNDFVRTARESWGAIAAMKDKALPIIIEKLKRVYPELDQGDSNSVLELKERAMLLLLNAFSGYMLNKGNGGEEYADDDHYGYGDHTEQLINVYEGGQPPYPTSAFVLDIDETNLPSEVELAASLVRGSRARPENGIKDPTVNFKTPEEFEEAVVPIMVHEIVRSSVFEEEWERLSKIEWSDLSPEWDSMKDEDFIKYLLEKGISDYPMMESINNLRKRMAVLFKSSRPVAKHLVNQFMVAIPTIMSADRASRFMVPFVKLGYSSEHLS